MRWTTALRVLPTTFALVSASEFAARGAMAQTPLAIKFGYQSTPDWLLFVARELKLFDRAGLAPTYVANSGAFSAPAAAVPRWPSVAAQRPDGSRQLRSRWQ